MTLDELRQRQNPYGDDKAIDACGLFGVIDRSGRRLNGQIAIEAMANLHDRGNGLGGGFAGYGIYPEMADAIALHVMLDDQASRARLEEELQQDFHIRLAEEIPHRHVAAGSSVQAPPLLWRYFLDPQPGISRRPGQGGGQGLGQGYDQGHGHEHGSGEGRGHGFGSGDGCPAVGASTEYDPEFADSLVDFVMHINRDLPGVYVFSCARNMGVFKGVGYPEDIGEFFRLDDYAGYMWTGHGRFPTNTHAWWGGAHPFSLLDWTVVHNGEISSYGTNRRFLEMYGYYCTLQTDTEVIAYAVDLLMRRHHLSVNEAALVLAAPMWKEIDRLPATARQRLTVLRRVYAPLLLNGPFTVIIARSGELIGLGDRVRLRPFVAASAGDRLYVASEEAAIRVVEPQLDQVWIPRGGEPVVGRLDGLAQAGVPGAVAASAAVARAQATTATTAACAAAWLAATPSSRAGWGEKEVAG